MKEINENKSLEQSIVLQKWKDNNFIGTYEGFTGVGKTKIGTIAACEFIRRNPEEVSLVVVPTVNLRDNEWEKSFIDWGYIRERAKVTIECIQTAYKFVGRHFNTIVIDEWHTTLGPEYQNLVKNNTYDRLLCLTATVDDDPNKLKFTQDVAPIIWRTPRERAISLKLVSPSLIFNLAVELTERERILYDYTNGKYLIAENNLGGRLKAYSTSQRFLRLSKADKTSSNMRVFIPENRVIYAIEANDVTIPTSMCRLLTSEENQILKAKIYNAFLYWKYLRERGTVATGAINKVGVTKQIIDRFPDRKAMIFSKNTHFADAITNELGDKCVTYHTGLTLSQRKESIARFSNNEAQHISSCKALNAGVDIPECSLGIATSGDSKKIGHTQRNGRTSRFIDGKVSYFINMYAKNTQELNWIRNGTKEMNPKWIESVDELPSS